MLSPGKTSEQTSQDSGMSLSESSVVIPKQKAEEGLIEACSIE